MLFSVTHNLSLSLGISNKRNVGKSHIACFTSWGSVYISVGQLHVTPISFKMESNMASQPIGRLGKSPILVCLLVLVGISVGGSRSVLILK